jgi:hypothetical protein
LPLIATTHAALEHAESSTGVISGQYPSQPAGIGCVHAACSPRRYAMIESLAVEFAGVRMLAIG